MKNHSSHTIYYLLEASILGFGFLILLLLNLSFFIQIGMLLGILALYISMGLIHHRLHHDMHFKIVLEYFLISVLLFSLFLFLKSGTI